MKKLIFAICLIPFLTACSKNFFPWFTGSPSTKTVVIMGAGQSNANNPIIWSHTAQNLQAMIHNNVTWSYFAVSNTSSWDWAENKYGLLDGFKAQVRTSMPNFILWEQGEADAGTTPSDYANNIQVVIAAAKAIKPDVQFVVALDGVFNSNPRTGQQLLVTEGQALLGPDIDAIRSNTCNPPDWHSNPHFTDDCKLLEADAWALAIKGYVD